MNTARLRQIANWLIHFPLHPFILAIYPILGLLAVNLTEVNGREVTEPLQVALAAVVIIFIVTRLISRNWQLAGLLTSLFLVWFYAYGHIYNQVKNFNVFGIVVGRHRYLIILWSAIILAVAIWMIKKHRSFPSLTLYLNIVFLILVAIPGVQIGAFYIQNNSNTKTQAAEPQPPLISWTSSTTLPDIYYIILDGYGRADALQQVERIDNSAFINRLQQLGFYVAECSHSNYTRTALSLTSTFNMEYLQTLNPQVDPGASTAWLLPYLKHNLVRQQLEQLGYQTIVFKNPWETLVWDDANIVYKSSVSGVLSPFEYLLLSTTVTWVYLDGQQVASTQLAYHSNYQDTLYALDKLQDVPKIPGPKFVFAHLVIPHSPYVFGPDGEYIDIRPYDTINNLYTDEDHRRGYTSALTYINKRMLEILPKLIQSSKTKPIIIVAGDHGTGEFATVTWNLEAFYTPDSQPLFYEDISPVNIFRVLFDAYYNGKFDLLPDKSYISTGGQYFNFQEIPNPCTSR